MDKLKLIIILLTISLTLNFYLFLKFYGLDIGALFSVSSKIGIIYEENCSDNVVANRICSIKVLEKRSDFAMIRVHYHYVKGDEHSNKIVVKSNRGSHDNVVGTQGGFDLIEGNNTIDIPFGMYRAGTYTSNEPYMSKYIMVEAQGITADRKRYTTPRIFKTYAEYEHPWYIKGEQRSW